MEVQAITRNVRMSAQKMREVVRQIQGLPAQQAVAVLAVVPRKSARLVAKTLKSAIANAENNSGESARQVGSCRYCDKHEAFYSQSPRLRRPNH